MVNRGARYRAIPTNDLDYVSVVLVVSQHELAIVGGIQEPLVASYVLHEGHDVLGRPPIEWARQAVHGVGFWRETAADGGLRGRSAAG